MAMFQQGCDAGLVFEAFNADRREVVPVGWTLQLAFGRDTDDASVSLVYLRVACEASSNF